MEHVGLKLKQLRMLLGLTQRDVAEKIGVTQQTIGEYEKTGSIPVDRRKDISDIYGLDVENYIKESVIQSNTGDNNNLADIINITKKAGHDFSHGMVFLCQQIAKKSDPDHICAEFLKQLDQFE